MQFSPELAEKRFGCGLSPNIAPPRSVADMLAGLSGPDAMASAHPIEPFEAFRGRMVAIKKVRRDMKKTRGTDAYKAHKKDYNALVRDMRQAQAQWFARTLARWTQTETGFRERLTLFWGDHFTAHGKGKLSRRATSPFIESAIRPRLAGPFEDMLIAAVTHPLMLEYLDQTGSVGPGSALAQKGKRKRGLNENLARELIELHTLGVGGAYSQTDVRELAELLTGLSFTPEKGMIFRQQAAEPGAETVLGQSYGGGPATLEPILAALRNLARHPDTARHLAWKLAVHFVSDDPDPALVTALADRYLATNGDLGQVYAALLAHPAAWQPDLQNVKPPFDFIASACRALAVSPDRLEALKPKDMATYLYRPLQLMGQTWQAPPGPDGLPEEDAAWITPQGLSARLRWAMIIPANLQRALPDPRDFLATALGSDVTPAVHFAANAAERRMDGVGLILTSPSFQRR